MTILLLLTGLAAIAAPGLRPATMLRAHPRVFTRLATLSTMCGLLFVAGALVLSTSVGVLHLVFGHVGDHAHLAPEGSVGALLSATTLAVVAIRWTTIAAHARRTRQRANPDTWLGCHGRRADHDIVVVPTTEPIAFSITERPRHRIVISEGLRDSLDADTLQLVIDHELAHARADDQRTLLLARCIDALGPITPFAGRTSAALRVAMERAADETATGSDHERRSRLAAHLGRHAKQHAGCEPDCAAYRSAQLTSTPVPEPGVMLGALVGILSLTSLAALVIAHASNDLAPYLALVASQ